MVEGVLMFDPINFRFSYSCLTEPKPLCELSISFNCMRPVNDEGFYGWGLILATVLFIDFIIPIRIYTGFVKARTLKDWLNFMNTFIEKTKWDIDGKCDD